MRVFRLDDRRQTLVLASDGGRLPEIVYWATPLPPEEDLTALAASTTIDITGGMLDAPPPLSICPERAAAFPGEPGLIAHRLDGTPLHPRFTLAGVEATETRIAFTFRDNALSLTYGATIALHPATHLVAARAWLEAADPIVLCWLAAPVFPAPQANGEIIEIAGRWCGEFQLNRLPWAPGARARSNPTGRTGHEAFPGLIVPVSGATNTTGQACAFHYAWSGGHTMIAEELPDGRRQVQFGHAKNSEPPAERFETATLYAAFSTDGLNGCATLFQRHVRDHIARFPTPATRRPVHYNCWEAVYFDHDLTTLKEIATQAAHLGAERFILDDGWFTGRRDDHRALGDWTVDPRKFPDGLAPLIDHVNALGMSFGLWFEPEMVSPDSTLHRTHPEWVLGPTDQPLGRHQLVLNMAREDVRAALFDAIARILSSHPIDAIKWDHNRVLPFADATQTRGTYALLDRLNAAFPHVEFESCAAGGGRIDLAILSRTARVWLSDSNDALERLRIQHDAALFLPMAVTGSHVGPARCHTSGRVLPMSLRAWVAAQRHMGFEMDPRELTDEDAKTLRAVTAWWKQHRAFLASADILRLDSADEAVLAEQHLGEDGARFIVFAGKRDSSRQIAPRPVRLAGLDPAARYHVDIVNREDISALSRGHTGLKRGPLTLSGAALMRRGLALPWSPPQSILVLSGERICV